MAELLISILALTVSLISFLLFIISNYDKLSKHYVSWKYEPNITIGISVGDSFVESDSIPYTELQPFDDEWMFTIAIQNSSDFDVELKLTVAVGPSMKTAYEYYGASDKIEAPFEVSQSLDHPPKRYEFSTFSASAGTYMNRTQFLLVLEPDDAEVLALRAASVELEADISADVSQFSIPWSDKHFPRNIGEAQFNPVSSRYEVLGPDHENADDFQ